MYVGNRQYAMNSISVIQFSNFKELEAEKLCESMYALRAIDPNPARFHLGAEPLGRLRYLEEHTADIGRTEPIIGI
jgi:hypothetical protein